VNSAAPAAEEPPRRMPPPSADAMRERLASYQRGLREGRAAVRGEDHREN
jgi:hypothetical protein